MNSMTPEEVTAALLKDHAMIPREWFDTAPVCPAPALHGRHTNFSHHLINRRTNLKPTTVRVAGGETLRFRIINAASMSTYYVMFDGLKATAIAVDANLIEPFEHEGFWVAPAQRMDVIVTIPNDASGHYLLTAHVEGTTSHPLASMLLLVGDSPVPSNLPTVSTPPGFMDVTQEINLHAFEPLPVKHVDRQLHVNLTGVHGVASINHHSYFLPPAAPLARNKNCMQVMFGERICIRFESQTRNSHPMHLHGHEFQIVAINDVPMNGAVRDTILIPRGECQTVDVCFDAMNPGLWLLHCHLGYHMMAGMMTTLEYVTEESDVREYDYADFLQASIISAFTVFDIVLICVVVLLLIALAAMGAVLFCRGRRRKRQLNSEQNRFSYPFEQMDDSSIDVDGLSYSPALHVHGQL